MPSHSIKQAKTMSAIAHGWKPKGTVAKIPVKVAKEFHAADAGHKYGKGMPYDKVKSKVKHYRKKYDAGGATDDGSDLPDVGPPAIPDRPFSPGVPAVNRYADAASKVAGPMAISAMTAGPLRHFVTSGIDAAKFPAGGEENHAALEDASQATADLGMSMLGSKSPYPGSKFNTMVGPYGAMMLRDAERESGEYPVVHPVYARQVNKAEYSPEQRGQMVDDRDAVAQQDLANGRPDRAVFANSGWSKDAAGNITKEIPDTGAKLVANGDGTYRMDHPAGDFHKIYDMPQFEIDKTMDPGTAKTSIYPDTGKVARIVLGTKDTDPRNKGVVSAALHEMQHVVASKEGFPSGASPGFLPDPLSHPDMPQQIAQEKFADPDNPHTPSWWSPSEKAMAAEARSRGVPEDRIADHIARFRIYENESGEAQARNVQKRFEENLYKQHPEDTEDVGRGLQWQWNRFRPRPQAEVDAKLQDNPQMARFLKLGFAKGGRAKFDLGGGFNPERAAAIGLSRQNSNVQKEGLINSSVPGRTDKINANVPSGSYVIPADITSALGEGNTFAGSSILNKMFTKGPFGMNIAKSKGGVHTHAREAKLMKMPSTGTSKFTNNQSFKFAKGGVTAGKIAPIVVAGGEHILHPDTVARLGNGDIDLGHSILDQFVKLVRAKHIKTLQGLKPPKGSKDAKGG